MITNNKIKAKVACVVIIVRDNYILMGRRKGGTGAGTFALPTGKVKQYELLEECAKREVMEETGLNVDELRLISVCDTVEKQLDRHNITFGFLAGSVYGEPSLREPQRCEGWDWYSLSDLPTPLFGSTGRVLEDFLSGEVYHSNVCL